LKHGSSSLLYAHWNERRGPRTAPERADVDPGAIRQALGDCFVIAFDAAAGHPFRLAGTRLCDLFGRELKGEPFSGLWVPEDRAGACALLSLVADEATPLIAGVTGVTGAKDTVELELLVLPLRHHGKTHARQIGVLAPLTKPFWLNETPLVALRLGPFRHLATSLGEESAAPVEGPRWRLRRGLIVFDGGRA
jgi:hypothetical protein